MAENEINPQPGTASTMNDASPQSELEQLRAELEDLRGQLLDRDQQLELLTRVPFEVEQQLLERDQRYMRLMADFENFRRRTQREKDDLGQFVTAKLLLDILPIVDNFERARSQVQPEGEREEKLNSSYQQVYRQFQGILKQMGVQSMEVTGQAFDPARHEAVIQEESPDVTQETVVVELQKGYLMGDKVLRTAMVKVAIPGTGAP
ncbi:MAG: nucleotide exchange factor GrpE [Gemmatimonadaceae bacterium]|nr:nucleotide exchange factor GrpE [Gloeobacterales cyanobacterium ES-bin-141]